MTQEAPTGEQLGQLIEARRSEAMTLFTTAKAYAVRNDQLMGIGVTLIAAVTGLGLKEDVDEVLLGAPAAFLLLIVYSLHVDTDVLLMTTVQRKLAAVLEDQLGEPALIYQSCADSRRPMLSVGLLQAVGVVLAAVLVVGGAVVAVDADGVVLVMYSVATGFLIAMAFVARRDRTRSQDEARKWVDSWAPRTFEEWRAPSP